MKAKNKHLDKIVTDLYNQYFIGIQVNIMNLTKLSKEIELVYLADTDNDFKDAEMLKLLAKYRVN